MDKIFNDACDKNVATNVIYADDDNKLYYDVDKTSEVAAADALNLFFKGVVCLKDTTYYAAISCTKAGVLDFGFPTEDEEADEDAES